MGKGSGLIPLKKRHRNGHQVYKRCSISPMVQIKTSMRCHLVPVEWLLSKSWKITSIVADVEKRNFAQSYGEKMHVPQK
jgi:hypothetical protein